MSRDSTERALMLSGLKVLDFTQYLAGPTVTRFMAEMGAEIIKVEQAPMGDPSRLLPMVKNGRSAYFVQQNRGKKSLCLDFAKPESIELLHSIVRKVDVVVENYGAGVSRSAASITSRCASSIRESSWPRSPRSAAPVRSRTRSATI